MLSDTSLIQKKLLYCRLKLKINIMSVAAILGAIGAATGLAGSVSSYYGQKSANRTNLKLAQQARAHDVNMWNRQNAYNTPEMQMHRLKEAGLNPNLIYGSGSSNTGNADSPQKAPVPEVNNALASFANESLIPTLNLYNDWQVKRAHIDLLNEQANNQRMDNLFKKETLRYAPDYAIYDNHYKRWRAENIYVSAMSKDEDYKYKKGTLYDRIQQQKNQTDILKNKVDYSKGRLNEQKEYIDVLKQRSRSLRLQADLDEQLKPLGVSTSDELWQRILAMFLQRFKPTNSLINKIK